MQGAWITSIHRDVRRLDYRIATLHLDSAGASAKRSEIQTRVEQPVSE